MRVGVTVVDQDGAVRGRDDRDGLVGEVRLDEPLERELSTARGWVARRMGRNRV